MDSNVVNNVSNDEFIIEGIFPKPVYFSDFREFKQEEIDFIKNLETKPNEGNKTSSNHYILEDERLKELKDFVLKEVNRFFQLVWRPREKDNLKVHITQSWANFTEKGQWHHKHAHANSFISGVLYITVDEKFDRISFFNDGYNHFVIPIDDSNVNNYNAFNSTAWWFPVKNSKLVMFKSDLTHMVPLIEESTYEGTRISVSFNTYLRGKIGDENTLTQLEL